MVVLGDWRLSLIVVLTNVLHDEVGLDALPHDLWSCDDQIEYESPGTIPSTKDFCAVYRLGGETLDACLSTGFDVFVELSRIKQERSGEVCSLDEEVPLCESECDDDVRGQLISHL